jgi:uncharacterized protein (TIGR00251 family)
MTPTEAAGGQHRPYMPVWARHDLRNGTLLLSLHVQPGASRTQCCGEHGGRLRVRVAARATEGAANHALLDFIAGNLGVPARDVQLVSGAGSRIKVIQVSGASAAALGRLDTA